LIYLAGMTNPRRKVQDTSEAWRTELARREGESVGPQPPLPQTHLPGSEESAQTADKIRENRLRRIAARQGLTLRKSPRRDPRALGYGTYMLADSTTRRVVSMDWNLPGGYGLDLDAIEEVLSRQSNAAESADVGRYSAKFACVKCGDEREVERPEAYADPVEVEMPDADAYLMTVEEYTALLKMAGMVLLCDDCAPHGTSGLSP
jgi:hypothetical protein